MFDVASLYNQVLPLGKRLDANETSFLNRQIEFVRSKVFEKRYANLLARRFIPQATDIPDWVTVVVEVTYDLFGVAKIVANNAASHDFPRSDTIATEGSYKVASLGSSYGFNLTELRQARALGVPLEVRRSGAARRSIEAGIDELLFAGTLTQAGQLTTGFTGLANNSSVPVIVSGATGLSWAGSTAKLIMADLNSLIITPEQTTKQIYRPNQILLAEREYDIINTTYFNDFSEKTILQAFLSNNPGVSVDKWYRLTGAGVAAGSLGSNLNRCISYLRDPEVVESILPLDFEQFAPQLRNLETVVNCHARCGGVQWHQPKAACYMDLDSSSS